jgi:hypothetical protein
MFVYHDKVYYHNVFETSSSSLFNDNLHSWTGSKQPMA